MTIEVDLATSSPESIREPSSSNGKPFINTAGGVVTMKKHSVPTVGIGTCRLTGQVGPFVKSHVLPRALTLLSKTGEKAIETGIGMDWKRRPATWYDNALVVAAGETILSEIDNAGIDELRSHRLIWSSWGAADCLPDATAGGTPDHRIIAFSRAPALRLFFLSLLWRAAASTRDEFKDIQLSPADLEDLRQRVLAKDPGDVQDYPIHLFQLVTKGALHNRAPLLELPSEVPEGNDKLFEGPRVRFYFDGLIAHVHLARGRSLDPDFVKTSLGEMNPMMVFAYDYKDSRTHRDLLTMVQTVSAARGLLSTPLTAVASAIQSIKTQAVDQSLQPAATPTHSTTPPCAVSAKSRPWSA